MANPKIQVDITGDAKGLKKATGDAGESLDKLGKKTDDLEKKGGKGFLSGLGDSARQNLGPLGEALDGIGVDLDGISAPVAAAGAAFAGLGAFAAQGVSKLTDLAGAVRKVHDISGLSFESSSRLVAISDDLGVSAETVATSMRRLAQNIDAGKLDEYGIAVVRAADGTVDMEATLGAVADAMNRTVDPTKRAAMGNDILGRSWADLAPILQQGSGGIREAMAAVSEGQIITEDNADAVREWEMALDDAQDAISEIQMAMAKDMIPTLSLMAKDFATVTQAVSEANGPFGMLLDVMGNLNPVTSLYNARLADQKAKAEDAANSMATMATSMLDAGLKAAATDAQVSGLAEAEDEAANKAAILTARQKDATQAAKDLTQAAVDQKAQLDILNGVVLTIADTQLAHNNAVAATRDSTDELTAKQGLLTDAVNTYGAESPEAIQATKDYDAAMRNAVGAANDQAKATADLAEQTAIAAGETFTAEQKSLVYRDALHELRNASTDPNLQGGLDALAGLAGAAATQAGIAAANFYDMEAAASRAAAVAANAISVGSSGITTSADAAERALTPQSYSTQSASTVINVNSPIGRPTDFVPWLNEELRRHNRGMS